MDFSFMGGSLGSAVGEKFCRACESAADAGISLVSVSSSGGARMQEGILALMQLPKTVCAVEDLRDSGRAFVSVLTHPTTGGLLASFASLGDVQQTTREKLPDDFGLAESNYRFGHVDAVVPRPELREYVAKLLRLFARA
jgi:acetyl-CoA carboxylase carboxyl transferase subunit beta